jgi:hypothetical protein
MKIFLLVVAFWLKLAKCCSLEPYFLDLIRISQVFDGDTFISGAAYNILKCDFQMNAEKLLSECHATAVLLKFYSICSDDTHFF